MTFNSRDTLAGGFFIAVGLFFCVNAWVKLPIGTAFQMGPGYFPIVLGVILAGLGVAIVFRGDGASEGESMGTIPIRGALLTSIAPLAFGLTVERLGLVVSLVITLLIAAPASYKVGPLFALGLAAALTLFCVIVFHYGLGLPIPLFGPWLSGEF